MSAGRLTGCPVVPRQKTALGEEKEPIEQESEKPEEEDAGPNLRGGELGLLGPDVAPEAVSLARELGDDDENESYGDPIRIPATIDGRADGR